MMRNHSNSPMPPNKTRDPGSAPKPGALLDSGIILPAGVSQPTLDTPVPDFETEEREMAELLLDSDRRSDQELQDIKPEEEPEEATTERRMAELQINSRQSRSSAQQQRQPEKTPRTQAHLRLSRLGRIAVTVDNARLDFRKKKEETIKAAKRIRRSARVAVVEKTIRLLSPEKIQKKIDKITGDLIQVRKNTNALDSRVNVTTRLGFDDPYGIKLAEKDYQKGKGKDKRPPDELERKIKSIRLDELSEEELSMLEDINEKREMKGLSHLTTDATVRIVAKSRINIKKAKDQGEYRLDVETRLAHSAKQFDLAEYYHRLECLIEMRRIEGRFPGIGEGRFPKQGAKSRVDDTTVSFEEHITNSRFRKSAKRSALRAYNRYHGLASMVEHIDKSSGDIWTGRGFGENEPLEELFMLLVTYEGRLTEKGDPENDERSSGGEFADASQIEMREWLEKMKAHARTSLGAEHPDSLSDRVDAATPPPEDSFEDIAESMPPAGHEDSKETEKERLVEEILEDGFSYRDVLGEEAVRADTHNPENAPKYADELARLILSDDGESVEMAANDIAMRFEDLRDLLPRHVQLSPYADSSSWIYWDIAKQEVLKEDAYTSTLHGSDNYSGSVLINPISSLEEEIEQALFMRDVVAWRHLGWEMHIKSLNGESLEWLDSMLDERRKGLLHKIGDEAHEGQLTSSEYADLGRSIEAALLRSRE